MILVSKVFIFSSPSFKHSGKASILWYQRFTSPSCTPFRAKVILSDIIINKQYQFFCENNKDTHYTNKRSKNKQFFGGAIIFYNILFIMKASRFLGVWRLLPQLCKYDVGAPPLKAAYSFRLDQQNSQIINVSIDWTDTNNKDFNVKYLIELDKQKKESLYGKNIQVLHELDSLGRLNSTTFDEEGKTVIMRSFRELKENDTILQVLMETTVSTGINKIHQTYRRQQ